MSKKLLQLGFIGGGLNSAVGATHFIAAQMDGLFKVAAGAFSRDFDVNMETSKKWGVSTDRMYTSWKDLLDKEKGELDAVVVLTPTPEHIEPIIEALKMGFPVISEKALACSSEDAKKIETVKVATNGFLAVTYNYSGYPMLRELKYMIESGKLGALNQIHIEMPQEGFARIGSNGKPMCPQHWRLQDGVVPTISLDLGVHVHHIIDFLTGEKPVRVVTSQASLGKFHRVIDNVTTLANYTNNLEVCIWFSKVALGHSNGLCVRVYGANGSAEWLQINPEVMTLNDSQGRKILVDRANSDMQVVGIERYSRFKAGHPSGFLEAFANLYADLYHQLSEGPQEFSDYVFSVREAYEGLRMLEAMNLSASENRWVSINIKN
jgi:predicted dehydrogenase